MNWKILFFHDRNIRKSQNIWNIIMFYSLATCFIFKYLGPKHSGTGSDKNFKEWSWKWYNLAIVDPLIDFLIRIRMFRSVQDSSRFKNWILPNFGSILMDIRHYDKRYYLLQAFMLSGFALLLAVGLSSPLFYYTRLEIIETIFVDRYSPGYSGLAKKYVCKIMQ